MKRRDELLVGFTILAALALVIAGAIWFSEIRIGQFGQLNQARFRTVGGLGVGSPVVLRGVRVGRISEIRLAEGDWVETVIQLVPGVALPERPAIIAASASLFGEWQAEIISLSQPIEDPNVRRDLDLSMAAGGDLWPGATLPDIGQLTAQAGRIATDIATVASRVQSAIDSTAVGHMQEAIRDFGDMAGRINDFAETETQRLGSASVSVVEATQSMNEAADLLLMTVARLDSATSDGEIEQIVSNIQTVSSGLRDAVAHFRDVMAVIQDNRASIQSVITGADTLVQRVQAGDGTVGRLVSDSTLYVETLNAIRSLQLLVEDIQANPRKYFKFSVF